MGEIDFFDLVPGSEQVEEDRLIRSLLTELKGSDVPLISYHSSSVHRARCIRS